MLKKLKYEQLAELGLVVYQPRVANIIPEHIRINARCLVLQHTLLMPVVLNPQQQKILLGMLSVLELSDDQIMHATIVGPQPNPVTIQTNIEQWQPEFILQLGMDMPDISRQNWIRTFSPAYLLQNPQYKAQAYKTLLSLRAMLNDESQRNT